MLEQRLKAVEIAIIRLTVAVDKLTEAQYATLKRVTVPQQPGKPVKPKRVTRDRLIEQASRYQRVRGQEDFDILLHVFDIETLADLEQKDFQKFYNQMLRELHEAVGI
jgi:hypothetical protein